MNEDKLFTARIGRHLLFNSLNSAMVLSRKNPKAASGLLDALSQCLLYASQSETGMVSLAEEISFIKSYFHIQSVRFGSRLQLVYNIQETKGRVPFFLFQPIADNVFTHVVFKTRESVTVTLEVKKTEQGVVASISDNRVGMDEKQLAGFWELYQGRSLHQLNTTLAELGLKGLEIASVKNQGTKVSAWVDN